MKWWIGATAQWSLAHVPAGGFVLSRLRERFGELAHLERSSRFDNALWFLRTARRWCGELGDLRVVELGTGWVPAVPYAFLLSGSRVDTYDVERLVRPRLSRRTLAEIHRRAAEFASAAGITEQVLLRRLSIAEQTPDFSTACRALAGSYRAPFNTLQLPYADGEADLVISNLVLQCIPRNVLKPVLAESMRVLRPGGLAIHRIRMSDEYAAKDPNRNHLEYLQYADRHWNRWFCHRLKHQNRLRASQFISVFAEVGGTCRSVDRFVDRDSIAVVERLRLADQFHGLKPEDLATINLDLVVQRPLAKLSQAANAVVSGEEVESLRPLQP